MSRGGRKLIVALLIVTGFLIVIAVATIVRLRADRVPQVACTPGEAPAAQAFDAKPFAGNLAVTALSDADLAKKGIARKGLGELDVDSGCLVATDPLVQPERQAFARSISPGRYAVTLYRAEGRVALAELRIGQGVTERWELAVLPGQKTSALKDDEVYGYPVDAGLGAFMDAAGQSALLTRDKREQRRLGASFSDSYTDILMEPLEKAGGTELLFEPLSDDTANVAIFQSGWGDGVYPSFWGLDAAGRPLALVTDFGVLDKGEVRPLPDPPEVPKTP